MNFIIIAAVLLLAVLPSAPAMAKAVLIGGDLRFEGEVVAYPCSVAPESERVPVNFGEISTKSLYINGKSIPVPFSIRLQDCNPGLLNTVSVTFSGDENPNLANHLAIKATAGGNASGVGIGLLEADNTPVRLGVPTTPVTIGDSVMQLDLQAFVEAEPDALSKGTLTAGPFSATAYYLLNYQ